MGLIVLAGVAVLLYLRWRETRTLRELVGLERRRNRAEAQYSALMREAKEIVLLIDGEGRIAEANDFALAAYGYSHDELVGQIVDVVMASPADLTLEERRRGLEAAGGHVTVESTHRRRDGVEFPVEVGLSSIVLAGEPYFLEIVRDVGERKAAEVALRDSETRYRTLFESALSGFALLEAVPGDDGAPVDFVVVAANAAFETQTGVPVAGIAGRRVTEAIPGIRDSDVMEDAVKVVVGRDPERFEVFYKETGRHLDIQLATPRPGQLAAVVARRDRAAPGRGHPRRLLRRLARRPVHPRLGAAVRARERHPGGHEPGACRGPSRPHGGRGGPGHLGARRAAPPAGARLG